MQIWCNDKRAIKSLYILSIQVLPSGNDLYVTKEFKLLAVVCFSFFMGTTTVSHMTGQKGYY